MKLKIRNELPSDYRTVEELTRKAFWNIHVPGCDEHLIANKLRKHKDFVKDLDFVATNGDEILANIMFSKSYLINDNDIRLDTLTFGPVSVLPEYQRQGIGSKLINHSIEIATKMGQNAIVIWGSPVNYCKFGFKASKTYNIRISNGKYPSCLLVKELKPGILSNGEWQFFESDAFEIDEKELEVFDRTFDYQAKEYQYSQEEFAILSRSFLE